MIYKELKLLFLDVDGTLTDGKVYIGNDGEIMKAFNIKDGYGIHDILIPKGIKPIVITGRRSNIVINRCKEIGINDIYQGITKKVEKMKEIITDYGIPVSNVAYMGDDLNDLECMRYIKENGGIVACPRDAENPIKQISDFISVKNGGDGAVRDFINNLGEKNA